MITGRTADLIIVDDPVAVQLDIDRAKVFSDKMLEWFCTWLGEQPELTQLQYAQFMTDEVRPDHTVEAMRLNGAGPEIS